MDIQVDHYAVLGLPSGVEGAKLSEKKIIKAYKLKALELHPDKRPDDPNAHANFQKLTTLYAILKDEKSRKLFDDLLRVQWEKFQRQALEDSKRRKMISDLETRERYAFASNSRLRAQEEEERIHRKLKEEIARIRRTHSNRSSATRTPLAESTKANTCGGGSRLEKESHGPELSNAVGAGYHAFEDSVLDKLLKAAQRVK